MISTILVAAVAQATIVIPLKPDLHRYNFAGTFERKAMYMPTMVKLGSGKPLDLKQPPNGAGPFSYGEIQAGSAVAGRMLIALDTTSNTLWFDLNRNGKFTDDLKPAIEAKPSESGPTSYQTTVDLKAIYGEGRKAFSRTYALNFYWRSGSTQLGSYRATAMIGSKLVNGKRLEVELTESNNQGTFHGRFDTAKSPETLRPISLLLNGRPFDPRGSFVWEDMNYLATISPDGSQVTLTPTARVVKAPVPAKPAERAPLLAKGATAPDFTVESDKGGTVKLSDFKGKVVILKFWATWCGPCIASMPHFEELNKQVSSQNVALLAICVADDRAPYKEWMGKNASKFTYPFYYDPAGRENGIHSRLFNVTGIPTVFVIDGSGKVVDSVVGYSDGDRRLEGILRGLGVKVVD